MGASEKVAATFYPDNERRAPVQGEGPSQAYADITGSFYKPPGTISWAEHVEVWEAYHARHPNHQTAEIIAERAGFGYREIVNLIGHEPTTWREVLR